MGFWDLEYSDAEIRDGGGGVEGPPCRKIGGGGGGGVTYRTFVRVRIVSRPVCFSTD